MSNFSTELDTYIKNVSDRSNLHRTVTERVINTQIALMFGDLAVKGKSECFLGTIRYNKLTKEITLEPNGVITDLTNGKIDPTIIIKEIFENV